MHPPYPHTHGTKAVGTQLSRDLDKATRAALKRFNMPWNKKYQLSVESEGGFLGFGTRLGSLIALVSPISRKG